jgi:acyl-CoA dehydrogenase
MAFFQEPPRLGNQFDDDPMLPSWVARTIGDPEIEAELRGYGELAVEHHGKQLADRDNEPVLTQWDAWGHRIDRIDVSPLWVEAQVVAATSGMVAAGYEARLGARARIHQFATVHVLSPSLDVYSCPLAMTDGAARTLLASAAIAALIDRLRAAPDVSAIRTHHVDQRAVDDRAHRRLRRLAERDRRAARRRRWRLYGTKWFTSATTSQMALTLARPEGNPDGSARARAVLRGAARRPTGGCATSRSTGSRTSSARARSRRPSSRSTARRCTLVAHPRKAFAPSLRCCR